MGHGNWSSRDWDIHAASTRGKSTSQIFNGSAMKKEMDPRNIKLRESRDSKENPNATPIILALDVTGSMGIIADHLAREGLGKLVESILDRKPVSDPHIMVMGVGDANFDEAPLQVSQFEADIRIAKQLKDIWLESGGGNNPSESYTLPWYFAAEKTEIDCVNHGRKGLLFTFGDEECPETLKREQLKKFLGEGVQADLSTKELYKMVSEKYDVFHVVIEEGRYAKKNLDKVYESWNAVLPPDRIISVKDYKKVPEVLVSVMEVHAGKPQDEVVASWQGPTAAIVKDAIRNVKPGADGVIPVLNPIKFKTLAGPAAP